MRRYLAVALSLLALLLAACQKAAPEDPATTDALPTAKALPTAEPTANALAEGDYCLGCHSSKEQLISTAKPEEVVEEESKGVG
jgi:hypothetical protein